MSAKKPSRREKLDLKKAIDERRRPETRPDADSGADALWVRRRNALAITSVLLGTMLVYSRCLRNGFVFDDHAQALLDSYLGRASIWWLTMLHDVLWFSDPLHVSRLPYYRPIFVDWFALNYQLFGFSAPAWHAADIGVHLIVVSLVFSFALRLTGDQRPAILAALLFGLMPSHAEAVAWSSGMPYPLAAVFELAILCLFADRDRASIRNWTLALALYPLALLSHESAVMLPAFVALYAFLIEVPERAEHGVVQCARRALVLAAPFALEVLAYLPVRWLVLGSLSRRHPANLATYAQLFLTLPAAFGRYLLMLAIPWFANPAHRFNMVESIGSPDFYLSLVSLIALTALFLRLIRNHPRRRLYLFCAGWIVLAIAPVLNLLVLEPGELLQDRYLYIPSIGWCVLLGDVVFDVARLSARWRRIAWGAAALVIASYATTLWSVQRFWHDDLTFLRRCVATFPDSALWHARLGLELEGRGDFDAAEKELRGSARLNPRDGFALYQLGTVHAQLGKTREATQEIAAGLKLMPNPSPQFYDGLAQLYSSIGEPQQAEAALKSAELLPGGEVVVALARVRQSAEQNDAATAERILRDLSVRYPDNYAVWEKFGIAVAAQHGYEQALPIMRHAVALASSIPETHFLTALALIESGRQPEALEECRAGLALAPDDPNGRKLLEKIEGASGPPRQSP